MRKYIFTCIYLLITVAAMAQPKRSIVNLIASDHTEGIKRNGQDVIKVYKGVFQQENSRLSSDSSYFYPQTNSFDAFGHVNINQGDTLNIYSDKLYYNGNTHVALLTDNVRMVDRDATLTTNYLTYNTATRIGTYTGGGKLVNKQNTLVSKNGYYFANSRDSYFRYNVVLTTNDATVRTDTLRYNSGSRISYFYGPTRIIGKQDKDTLYTENGTYNTATEQAFFGKKNLYTQGTKSLKGDSLFYDRLKGYGRAVKNITFNDNEQKITLKGNLGTFYRADERTVVTQNPYAIIITEEKDTTRKDTVPKAPVAGAKKITAGTIKNTPPNITPVKNPPATSASSNKNVKANTDSLSKPAAQKMKRDTLYWGADTLETQIVTYKTLKAIQERMRLAGIKDTSNTKASKNEPARKPLVLSTTKHIILMPPAGIKPDSSYLRQDIFGKPKVKAADTVKNKVDTVKNKTVAKAAVPAAKQKAVTALPTITKTDSVYLTRKFTLSDTSRVRIVSAHHHAKIFKSDLQAKADSMFYSYSDSTMRCYVNPIFWTQGSQLSGDTILLQLKNKKMDNMDIFPSAFIVNIEGTDSTHFNQVAGKKMRGFFVDNKLQRMFVDGNAETIYYSRDSGRVDNLLRTISSRIRVNFKNNKATNITLFTKTEQRVLPINKIKEDDKILKGFLWKPKERPANKEAVISPRKLVAPAKSSKKPADNPAQVKEKETIQPQPAVKQPATDSTSIAKPQRFDSTSVKKTEPLPAPKTKTDSTTTKKQ